MRKRRGEKRTEKYIQGFLFFSWSQSDFQTQKDDSDLLLCAAKKREKRVLKIHGRNVMP